LLTFTLPAELRQIASQNQKLIYNMLFRASAQAAQQLAQDPRLVGGQIGLVGILHTWTRNLIYHPHVHYLAPGGGLRSDGLSWLPARKNFFLPVKALSILFRAAFQRALKKTAIYANVPSKVWRKDWVVHCKAVGDGQAALKYLAPYIHRIAISNRRLLSLSQGSLENAQLTFQYRASDTGQLKQCSLSAEIFIHRFLQHVLPRGFVKVRYYGFFAPTCRSRLTSLQKLLVLTVPQESYLQQVDPDTKCNSTPPVTQCPKCGSAMFILRRLCPLACRSP
jgi:hypothetical protein